MSSEYIEKEASWVSANLKVEKILRKFKSWCQDVNCWPPKCWAEIKPHYHCAPPISFVCLFKMQQGAFLLKLNQAIFCISYLLSIIKADIAFFCFLIKHPLGLKLILDLALLFNVVIFFWVQSAVKNFPTQVTHPCHTFSQFSIF